MVEVNKDLVKKVAKVARITLSDEEVEKYEKQMKNVLSVFDVLDEIDTENIKPSFHSVPVKDSLRDDIPRSSMKQVDALKNAKNKEDGYFKGPRAV